VNPATPQGGLIPGERTFLRNVQEGDLRLAGGVIDSGLTDAEGLIEVYHDGAWGSVCNHKWTIKDAEVTCKQLGYMQGTTTWLAKGRSPLSLYGNSTGPIWLSDVKCKGVESKLADCSSFGWGNTGNCDHAANDAGAFCYDPASPPGPAAQEGDLRLTGDDGTTSTETMSGKVEHGRLEIFHDGKWGTMCSKGFSKKNAQVACHQLGFEYGTTLWSGLRVKAANAYGIGTGPIWLDEITCDGTEEKLTDCRSDGWGSVHCTPQDEVGVYCNTNPFSPDPPLPPRPPPFPPGMGSPPPSPYPPLPPLYPGELSVSSTTTAAYPTGAGAVANGVTNMVMPIPAVGATLQVITGAGDTIEITNKGEMTTGLKLQQAQQSNGTQQAASQPVAQQASNATQQAAPAQQASNASSLLARGKM